MNINFYPAQLLAIVLLVNNHVAECFSSTSHSISSLKELNIEKRSYTLPGGHHQASKKLDYPKNHITAIEDQSTHPHGLFLASSDKNYAIVSPNLALHHWNGLAVNEDNVFIIRSHKSVEHKKLAALSMGERDFIAEVRSNFTQNLAGLESAQNMLAPSLRIGLDSYKAYTQRGGKSFAAYGSRSAGETFQDLSQEVEPSSYRSFKASKSRPLELLPGECSPNLAGGTNYYNLLRSPLNSSLNGDVYYFDFYCNILEVYSSSISVRRQSDMSLLYRDHRYFSYSSAAMPLSINRFFLMDDVVIFVFNDGDVVLKQSWMLTSKELDIIIRARYKLRGIAGWQHKAASLMTKFDKKFKQHKVEPQHEHKHEPQKTMTTISKMKNLLKDKSGKIDEKKKQDTKKDKLSAADEKALTSLVEGKEVKFNLKI